MRNPRGISWPNQGPNKSIVEVLRIYMNLYIEYVRIHACGSWMFGRLFEESIELHLVVERDDCSSQHGVKSTIWCPPIFNFYDDPIRHIHTCSCSQCSSGSAWHTLPLRVLFYFKSRQKGHKLKIWIPWMFEEDSRHFKTKLEPNKYDNLGYLGLLFSCKKNDPQEVSSQLGSRVFVQFTQLTLRCY